MVRLYLNIKQLGADIRMPIPENKKYTSEEFFRLAENNEKIIELINGEIVDFASPSQKHQEIAGGLYSEIRNYIKSNNGKCKPFIAPFDVKLNDDNVVIPDVMVICDSEKLDGKRCNGAPDWVIEVTSTNYKSDYCDKLVLYKESGVREYWIVDPSKQMTFVYFFENENIISMYTFSQTITVNIYKKNPIQLNINIAELLG